MQHFLTLWITLNVGTPFLLSGIGRVRENTLRSRNERARINSVEQLLFIERHASNVDGLEPLFNLRLTALACVNQQVCVTNHLLLLDRQRRERMLSTINLDRELAGHKPAYRRDPLLAV